MKKHILITGAAGFIGFHLASHLKKQGHFVLGYDNFNPYYTPKLKRDREKLLKNEEISIVDGDLLEKEKLKQLIETHEITHIVHLAAQAGVRYSIQKPEEYVKANISGFLNILELCKTYTRIKLIYASSSSVYGLNDKTPFSENDQTDAQASFYGVTKKTNELMATTYHHLYNIHVTGLRFFTVYGPWGRPDMAYFSFAKAIKEGQPIELYNHGKMERDFTYIDDIVMGIEKAIDLAAPLEIFNLGNHKPVELKRFIEILEQSLGIKAKMILKPMQLGDVQKTYADIEHSQSKLDFNPKTSLEEGIPRFVDWFMKHPEFHS